jgi:glutaredoxin
MTDKNFFHVYALMSCPFCKMAVDLLQKKNKTYALTILDNQPSMLLETKDKFSHPTVPIVTVLNENKEYDLVGGFTELEAFLSD